MQPRNGFQWHLESIFVFHLIKPCCRLGGIFSRAILDLVDADFQVSGQKPEPAASYLLVDKARMNALPGPNSEDNISPARTPVETKRVLRFESRSLRQTVCRSVNGSLISCEFAPFRDFLPTKQT